MRLAVVISVALAMGGCQDHKLAQLVAVKDEVCACKTAQCAEAAMKKVPETKIDSNHRSQAVARDMMSCLSKLLETEQLPADPQDEPTPAPAAAAETGSAAAPAP
jgi:hypothetical protein